MVWRSQALYNRRLNGSIYAYGIATLYFSGQKAGSVIKQDAIYFLCLQQSLTINKKKTTLIGPSSAELQSDCTSAWKNSEMKARSHEPPALLVINAPCDC